MTIPQEPRDQDSMIPAPPLSQSELRGTSGNAGPAPKEVQLSFWLWITSSVLSVISAALGFTQRDEVRDALRQAPGTEPPTEADLDAMVSMTLAFGVVVALVFACLYVLFAVKARAGRGWARIVLTVLTALSVLSLAIGQSTVIAIVATMVAVVAVVLLFLPVSNLYFASARRPR